MPPKKLPSVVSPALDAPTRTIRFDPTASLAKRGVALLYDLESFSQFFNQPDVQDYVPKYLNRVSEALSNIFYGGSQYWVDSDDKTILPPLLPPIHEKFLGDGALYIWTPPDGQPDFERNFTILLCNRLWNLKSRFENVLKRCADDVPVAELPRRIRFGLARGTVYELTSGSQSSREYIGFCINLASRLQKYCPDLGFVASARLEIPAAELTKHGYKKVVATNLRGFPKEVVVVDKLEYNKLDPKIRSELFAEL